MALLPEVFKTSMSTIPSPRLVRSYYAVYLQFQTGFLRCISQRAAQVRGIRRPGRELNPRVGVLQTPALPLRHQAGSCMVAYLDAYRAGPDEFLNAAGAQILYRHTRHIQALAGGTARALFFRRYRPCFARELVEALAVQLAVVYLEFYERKHGKARAGA